MTWLCHGSSPHPQKAKTVANVKICSLCTVYGVTNCGNWGASNGSLSRNIQLCLLKHSKTLKTNKVLSPQGQQEPWTLLPKFPPSSLTYQNQWTFTVLLHIPTFKVTAKKFNSTLHSLGFKCVLSPLLCSILSCSILVSTSHLRPPQVGTSHLRPPRVSSFAFYLTPLILGLSLDTCSYIVLVRVL